MSKISAVSFLKYIYLSQRIHKGYVQIIKKLKVSKSSNLLKSKKGKQCRAKLRNALWRWKRRKRSFCLGGLKFGFIGVVAESHLKLLLCPLLFLIFCWSECCWWWEMFSWWKRRFFVGGGGVISPSPAPGWSDHSRIPAQMLVSTHLRCSSACLSVLPNLGAFI